MGRTPPSPAPDSGHRRGRPPLRGGGPAVGPTGGHRGNRRGNSPGAVALRVAPSGRLGPAVSARFPGNIERPQPARVVFFHVHGRNGNQPGSPPAAGPRRACHLPGERRGAVSIGLGVGPISIYPARIQPDPLSAIRAISGHRAERHRAPGAGPHSPGPRPPKHPGRVDRRGLRGFRGRRGLVRPGGRRWNRPRGKPGSGGPVPASGRGPRGVHAGGPASLAQPPSGARPRPGPPPGGGVGAPRK